MEEREAAGAGAAEEDQKGVYKFKNLGEIANVTPEKHRSTWESGGRREADHPSPAVVGYLVEGGEGAAHGHGEGEEAEDDIVCGGRVAEGGGREGWQDGEAVEEESGREVSDDCDGGEERRSA